MAARLSVLLALILGGLASARAASRASAPCDALAIDARESVHETAAYFASFNVDSSRDRAFFDVDLGAPALVAAAAALAGGAGGGHLRFGGTGNNALFYGVGDAPACPPTVPGRTECLNDTLWRGVAGLAAAARAPIVFGVNFFPNASYPLPPDRRFDPTNAVAFFGYARARGDPIFGVELGNELNSIMTAQEQARGMLALDAALAGVYGSDPRPVLIGPDALGIHTPQGGGPVLPTSTILQYMADYVAAMQGRLFAMTHHEYIEVNATSVLSPDFLDLTAELAALVVAKIRNVSAAVEIWAGEVGPHNGGTTPNPDCAGNVVCGRFGSAIWYADAMSAKARAGYAAFCRQDFIGADYGLVNYTSLAPTPDWWLLVLWKRLVGTRVVAVAPPADRAIRAYGFCGPTNGTMTLVLINLASEPKCVGAPGLANKLKQRTHFAITPSDASGVAAVGARLNGELLALGPGGALPPLPGVSVAPAEPISLPPVSVTLVTFPTVADACGD